MAGKTPEHSFFVSEAVVLRSAPQISMKGRHAVESCAEKLQSVRMRAC